MISRSFLFAVCRKVKNNICKLSLFFAVFGEHGKDHEELARKQFTAEHKKEVSSLIKYFFLYLQDLAYVHFDTVLVTFKSLVQHR